MAGKSSKSFAQSDIAPFSAWPEVRLGGHQIVSPALDDDLGLARTVEDLAVEQLIAKAGVEPRHWRSSLATPDFPIFRGAYVMVLSPRHAFAINNCIDRLCLKGTGRWG